MAEDITVKVNRLEMVILLRHRLDAFKKELEGIHQESRRDALKPLEQHLQEVQELFATIKQNTFPR